MFDPSDITAFRFGYGLPAVKETPLDPVKLLKGPDLMGQIWAGPSYDEVLANYQEVLAARRMARRDDRYNEDYKKALKKLDKLSGFYLRQFIARALTNPDGLRERLLWFWADHFTAVATGRDRAVLVHSRMDHALRPHIAGRFADMLRASVLHPAVMIYLDQHVSAGPNSRKGKKQARGLNENFARELIELHTLGVGGPYQQQDVRELAKILTGLTFKDGKGRFFDPGMAEPGDEVFLGKRYGGRELEPILQVLDDLAHHPATAQHLARKLAVHFLSDTPDRALVDRMAQAYLDNDTGLPAMYDIMVHAPQAVQLPMQKARQPVEFVICALRALGITGSEVIKMEERMFRHFIHDPLQSMGQPWNRPVGPDGWPEKIESWITSQRLAARMSWAMQVPSRLLAKKLPDPLVLLARCLGSFAGDDLKKIISRAETAAEGVGLIFAAPEFNRR